MSHSGSRVEKGIGRPFAASQWILGRSLLAVAVVVVTCLFIGVASVSAAEPPLTLSWKNNLLHLHGEKIPGGVLEIWYLEAYCRDNSHTTDWGKHTVVGHRSELLSLSDDKTELALRCHVDDGLVVDHRIKAGADEVDFHISAHNPTQQRSVAHWAQPCLRVGQFTGCSKDQTDDAYAYIKKSFVFLDGKLARMPTREWATQARYTPGQVWAAPGVKPSDVNPRPLNPHTPSHGLIGCFNEDESMVLALAFEPYQELFQGVIRCLHSDFRLGGVGPGETKKIRGKLYLVRNDIPALLRRYQRDFPDRRQQ